jgi:hypothetical protein
MNNLNIISAASVDFSEHLEILKRPGFRKATTNMALAIAAIEKAITQIKSIFEDNRSDFGLVLVSNSGELETTIDFLKTLDNLKIARPFLFQNSVHNATAGFLSIHLELNSPAVSISSGTFSEEQAIETANLLINGGQCKFCFVLSIDVWPELQNIPLDSISKLNGATCFIFSDSPTEDSILLENLEIEENFLSGPDSSLWIPQAFEKNSLWNLEKEIKVKKQGSLRVKKQDVGFSNFSWRSNQC